MWKRRKKKEEVYLASVEQIYDEEQVQEIRTHRYLSLFYIYTQYLDNNSYTLAFTVFLIFILVY